MAQAEQPTLQTATKRSRNIRETGVIILVVATFASWLLNAIYHDFLHFDMKNDHFMHAHLQDFVIGDEKPEAVMQKSGIGNTKKMASIGDAIDPQKHRLADISCEAYGGPSREDMEEMVYWSDIPNDATYASPFRDPEKYLTFEPDHGGWNNIRMAMETTIVLAHAMGRTLVLPPEAEMYLLKKGRSEQKTDFGFNDFFHLDWLDAEHTGIDIITMDEFLKREAMTGRLMNMETNEVLKPPKGQVDWNGKNLSSLWTYLRTVGFVRPWNPMECLAAFPASSDPKDIQKLHDMMDEILKDKPQPVDFAGKPFPVDAPPIDRLRENLADRDKLCIYDEEMQQARLVHIKVDRVEKTRLLIHFYSFLFFEDWKQDLWTKRFVRDHIRYRDEMFCAAGRIVKAVRERAKSRNPDKNPEGLFDSFHIRRGDFQYKKTRVPAEEILDVSKDTLEEGATVYIATDERKKEFFKPLADKYDVVYLDDFMHLIPNMNTNYFGMLDALVASKGRIFWGTWFSTFSSYINRMRGYTNAKNRTDGYEDGTMKSWYFAPLEKKDEMHVYWPSRKPFYMREFPTCWRDIDRGIDEL